MVIHLMPVWQIVHLYLHILYPAKTKGVRGRLPLGVLAVSWQAETPPDTKQSSHTRRESQKRPNFKQAMQIAGRSAHWPCII